MFKNGFKVWVERIKEETFTNDNLLHLALGVVVIMVLMFLRGIDPNHLLVNAACMVLWLREATQWQVKNSKSRMTLKSLVQGGELHHLMEWIAPSIVLQVVARVFGIG